MFNKDIIDLQKGCKATCVVIQDNEYEKLNSKIVIDAKIGDYELLNEFKKDLFKRQEIDYFIIKNIDKISEEEQQKYYHLVKDREFMGYVLPDDVIIVLTVKDKNGIKNISSQLNHFCVVAF